MGISILIAIVNVLIIIGTLFVPVFLIISNPNRYVKPNQITWIALLLLIGHWIFFMVGGYSLLPVHISDILFVPIWSIVGLFGVLASILEFKNNKYVALPVIGLSIISILFCWLVAGISAM